MEGVRHRKLHPPAPPPLTPKQARKRARKAARIAERMEQERQAAKPPMPQRQAIRFDPLYSRKQRDAFFASDEWRDLRYRTLKRFGARCLCCGANRTTGAILHVDHVVPVAVNWSRRNDPSNLQILCEDCNIGKAANFSDDWRVDEPF